MRFWTISLEVITSKMKEKLSKISRRTAIKKCLKGITGIGLASVIPNISKAEKLPERGRHLIEFSLSDLTYFRIIPDYKTEKIADLNPVFNPFFRPNIHSKNYYGSGDVNDDGKVCWDDYELIKAKELNDYVDVSGSGRPSLEYYRYLNSSLLEQFRTIFEWRDTLFARRLGQLADKRRKN